MNRKHSDGRESINKVESNDKAANEVESRNKVERTFLLAKQVS